MARTPNGAAAGCTDALTTRLAQLHAMAAGGTVAAAALEGPRTALRLLLEPLVGQWHDGDENLVRGLLEGWAGAEADRPAALAARLLEAGDALLRMGARPEAWWFYVWEMESLLALVAGGGRC